MIIQKQKHGAVCVLRAEGPIVDTDCDQFKSCLLQATKENLGRIVLDISAIRFLDSKGLEALVDVTGHMVQSGQSLKLCAVSKTIREVFELTGISSQFEYYEDLNSAVRSFL